MFFSSQGPEGRHRQQPGAADHQPHPDERPVPQIIRQVSSNGFWQRPFVVSM